MYHYVQSEPGLWTVGTGTPASQGGKDWMPESDHTSPEAAAERVRFLNGGSIEKLASKSDEFWGGLLTALIVINHFDEPVIIEEIMGTLNDENREEFIQFAKDNEEYELAGLDKYEAHMKESVQ